MEEVAHHRRRPKRCTRKMNYSETQNGNDDNDDDDFEIEKSNKKTLNGKTKNKSTINKSEGTRIASNALSTIKSPNNSFGYGVCPNLSEDESSESSDDDIPIAKLKTTRQKEKSKTSGNSINNEAQHINENTEILSTENRNNIPLGKFKSNQQQGKRKTLDTSKNEKAQQIKESVGKAQKPSVEKCNKQSLDTKKSDIKKRKASSTEPRQSKQKKKKVKIHITDCAKLISPLNEVSATIKYDHPKSESVNEDVIEKKEEVSSNESEGEWQDVEEAKMKSPKKTKRKSKNATEVRQEKVENEPVVKDVEISVGVASIHNKKRKTSRQEKMFIWLRQMAGRFLRERKLLLHKCHLLCLLAKHLKENEICNENLHQGVFLSLIPIEFTDVGKSKWGVAKVNRFLEWFQKEIPSVEELLLYIAQEAIEVKNLNRIHIVVMMLRSLGFLARIIVSMQPISHKVKEENATDKVKIDQKTPSLTATTNKRKRSPEIKSLYFNKEAKKIPTTKRNKSEDLAEPKQHQQQEKQEASKKKLQMKKYGNRKRLKVNYNEETLADHDTEAESVVKRGQKNKVKKLKEGDGDSDNDSDGDFEPKRSPVATTSSRKRSTSKILSTSELSEISKTPQKKLSKKNATGVDIWCEVYLESMQSWICVELTTTTINKPEKCEELATRPLQYVIGIDNNQKVKDVTCRYAEKWLSVNRKLRVDREWWAATVSPYKPNKSIIDTTEEAQLKKHLLDQDFPKSISEFKNHPLYVLPRHLLKYEAIYPETAVPLGYIRKEAIYSRECVQELHTRETWLKQARTVKQGEEPYKLVKGRPKRHTPDHEKDKVKVEVFGLWQTEVYVPPPVKDGKVPKNEYGNVELFQPSMLPEGAVHLPMNNMQKIARKLNIDHAQAMMGWDFHGGWSHPVFEGIVVAKEFEDVLLDAWRQEEEKVRQKEKEKREKAIYDNWKTMIKGILIRHKLKCKYNFDDENDEKPVETQKTTSKKGSVKSSNKPAAKKERNSRRKKEMIDAEVKDEYTNLSVSWPQNRLDGATSLADDGHVHVFDRTEQQDSQTVQKCSCGLHMTVDNLEKI